MKSIILLTIVIIGVLILIGTIIAMSLNLRTMKLQSIAANLPEEPKKPVENNKYKYTKSFLKPYMHMDNILQYISSIDLFGIYTYDDFKEILATTMRKDLYSRISADGKISWVKEEFDETDIIYLQILEYINSEEINTEVGKLYDQKINDRMSDIVKEEETTSQHNAKIGDVLDDNFIPEDLGIAHPKNEDEENVDITKDLVSMDDLSEDYEDF